MMMRLRVMLLSAVHAIFADDTGVLLQTATLEEERWWPFGAAEEEPKPEPSCILHGMRRDPVDMEGAPPSKEASADACQERCLNTPDCVYFSFWAGSGACRLQNQTAQLVRSWHSTTAPAKCSKPVSCAEAGLRHKPDMPKQGWNLQQDAAACQRRCKSVPGCAYFTFRKDGRCHLQDASAVTAKADAEDLTGPADCDATADATEVSAAAATPQDAPAMAPASSQSAAAATANATAVAIRPVQPQADTAQVGASADATGTVVQSDADSDTFGGMTMFPGEDTDAWCFKVGVHHVPLHPPGFPTSVSAKDAFECQALCAATRRSSHTEGTPICAFFTYWPDGSCDFQQEDAQEAVSVQCPEECKSRWWLVTTGPAKCAAMRRSARAETESTTTALVVDDATQTTTATATTSTAPATTSAANASVAAASTTATIVS